ncbi:CoA-disulfide reductase [Defluviitalea saccharophila]|uniref:CoA-disulfide reductase n=1 Tax=Defluviitalea saccharophila TaxID=879970 RepID=A0ABZ2Y5W1_9FIRM
MSRKILIVGGVAGGASAAARLRRLDETLEIILFEKGEYISFANCGLPYYIGGSIEDRDMLFVQTPEEMKERFNIDVRVRNEVIAVDGENRKVKVKNHITNTVYEETYDDLILSPGSKPLRPSIPGIDAKNIFTLWNIPDVDAIQKYILENNPRNAVVVGGGFIGLEMAENLYNRDIHVSIIEAADQVMGPMDYDMASLIHHHILSKNVHLYLGNGVKEFISEGKSTKVILNDGKFIDADLIILSIGVRPNTEFLRDSSIELNERGGIKVNEYLETSVPHIYAVGDAIEVEDFVNQSITMIPLAGPANKQGRIVANNIAGRREKYHGTQGTSIAKVFDLTVASTGNNEKTLKLKGIPYITSVIEAKSHAGYYPGALPMTIKLIFSSNGKILGAQIIGYDGVDKRIDVIAAALRFEKSVFDLEELELAYAPPYSSAKDPVNMAGYVASNILNNDMEILHWYEIEKLDLSQSIILDIREKIERELGYIPNSYHIPLNSLRKRMNELPKDKEIIVYCQVGLRGYIAYRMLIQNGFNKVRNLIGGYKFYDTIVTTQKKLKNQSYGLGEGEMKNQDQNKQEVHNTETRDIKSNQFHAGAIVQLNACGLSCPGPIMKVYQKMNELKSGDILEVTATDPGFANDIKTWAEKTGNTCLSIDTNGSNIIARIQKGTSEASNGSCLIQPLKDHKTIVVFSGDLDKAIASFIIANGAASMGKKVTMFFTFWGLNILRKDQYVPVNKDMKSKMFGMMMPRGSRKLGLSKMNMFGMGSKMIRRVMQKKNISSLEQLIEQANQNGIKLMACQMSMDVMGIQKDELIDGVEIGGVATYLGEAEDSNVNLFI